MKQSNETTQDPRWERFRRLARERFSHGKVFGVRVAGGIVVSFSRVCYTKSLSVQTRPDRPAATSESWRRFALLCEQMGEAEISEVHFRDGEPHLVQLEETGCDLSAA